MFKALRHLWMKFFGLSEYDKTNLASSTQTTSNSQITESFVAIDAPNHSVPYDENLLDRARTQWQIGDWHSLAKLDRDTLQHHPERAKLVLLAAAGRLQIGQDAETRQYVRCAQDWGCSKKQISQILISGVHNTIGMAALIGAQQQRAAMNFEKAISIGSPNSEIKLLAQARTAHLVGQFVQIDLPLSASFRHSITTSKTTKSEAAEMYNSFEFLADSITQQNTDFKTQLTKQNQAMDKVRDTLTKTIKTEVTNATKQLEAFFGIKSYFETGEVIGELHGWPISPDLGLYLIQQLEATPYNLVIEFGSGTSTQLMAKTLAAIAERQPTRAKPKQVAFEHLAHYYQKTLLIMQQSGLAHAVDLQHAPLVPYQGPDGATYSYYECEEKLRDISVDCALTTAFRIFILVDGPPDITGIHARYPALHVVLKYFAGAQIDIVLDDYKRPDEEEVVNKWLKELVLKKIPHELVIEKLEKGACMLRINGLKNVHEK
jgi:hypothetical protein